MTIEDMGRVLLLSLALGLAALALSLTRPAYPMQTAGAGKL